MTRQRASWDDARLGRLKALWPDHSVAQIADELRTSRGAIYAKARFLDLPNRPDGRPRKRRSSAGAAKGQARRHDATRQRRFTGVKHDAEGPRIVLPDYHPASREGTTFFPSTVVPASHLPRILKSGVNSRKIGAVVAKGRWANMPLFTLTLEERETCPRTCREWASCYGNNMHWSQRVADDGTLALRLWGELASLSAQHPGGFVVRLHVLGDFYSVAYVEFWRSALEQFPPLRIFGFTARQPDTPIGAAIAAIADASWDRFAVRFSGADLAEGAAEVIDQPADATGILCPAQSDPERCCATCGLCWATRRNISFVRH